MLSMPAASSHPASPDHPASPEQSEARPGLVTLVRAFASSLVLEPVSEPEPAPVVYTAAIHTTADLVSSLIGITELSRDQGFNRHPETNYGDGGRHANYHVDHSTLPVSLTVNCNPPRQTVAIAVSGLDSEETLRCFQDLELALFGSC
ncbi:MAG: hypothetical protein ACKOPS_10260 [Cyanobium sp.]